jgi:nonsense-mediated mRNA decay protein 3
MVGLICPRCGESDEKKEFVDSFCIDCLPIKLEHPKKFEYERCKKCERIKVVTYWKQFEIGEIEKHITSKCKGEFEKVSVDFDNSEIVFDLGEKRKNLEVRRKIEVAIKTTICPDCNKISGGYFEACIQLRGEEKRVTKMATKIIEMVGNKTFLSRTEETENGLDLLFGSSKAIVGIVNELGYRVTITKKLVGQEQGKRLFRTTFLIRLDEGKKGARKNEKEEEKPEED